METDTWACECKRAHAHRHMHTHTHTHSWGKLKPRNTKALVYTCRDWPVFLVAEIQLLLLCSPILHSWRCWGRALTHHHTGSALMIKPLARNLNPVVWVLWGLKFNGCVLLSDVMCVSRSQRLLFFFSSPIQTVPEKAEISELSPL